MGERYRDLTRRQTEVLAEIATGNVLPRTHPVTISTLEAKGLIDRCGDKVLGRDRFGTIAIPQYEMPIHEHIPFIAWLADQRPAPAIKDEEES